ncbi:MAG: hypothetical protein R3C25_14630 [Hyphomonadaceae bacterium]
MSSAKPRAQNAAPGAPAPVTHVLSSLAEELERTRTLGLRVEGAICAIAVRSAIDGSVVAELQQLDAVLQQIAALRDYAAQLAAQCDPGYEVDTAPALDRITLAELRTRLGGSEAFDGSDEGWEML